MKAWRLKAVEIGAEGWWHTKNWARRLWLIVRHRPLLTCPLCKGQGGEMSGYEEPEWSECYCWYHWNDLEDHGLKWFVGRLPVWRWVRATLSIRFGLWYPARVRNVVRCKIGVHRWKYDDVLGESICLTCYRPKASPGETDDDAPKRCLEHGGVDSIDQCDLCSDEVGKKGAQHA